MARWLDMINSAIPVRMLPSERVVFEESVFLPLERNSDI